MQIPSFRIAPTEPGTPKSVDRRRRLAEAMLTDASSTAPVGHWTQAAARVAQGLFGGMKANRADKAEEAGLARSRELLAKALQGGDSSSLMEAMNDPYQSQAGLSMLGSKWDQANQPPPDPMEQQMKQLQMQKLKAEIGQIGQPKQAELPASIREYEYAKSQGFPGSLQEWESTKRGGMSLQVDPSTGQMTFQQGGNIKPLTESQSKDTVFSTRASGALPTIDQFGDSLTSLKDQGLGAVPGGLGRPFQSKDYQLAEQAGLEFLQAILRKDTGAAITPEETSSYGQTYLPRYGDSQELLNQKKAARARAVAAIEAGMPPSAILAKELALQKTANPAAPQQAPAGVPEGVDPEVWNIMTPQEKALWQN